MFESKKEHDVFEIKYHTEIVASDFSRHGLNITVKLKILDHRWQSGNAKWPDDRRCHQKLTACLFRSVSKTSDDQSYVNTDSLYKEVTINEVIDRTCRETYDIPFLKITELLMSIISSDLLGTVKNIASLIWDFGSSGSKTNCNAMISAYDANVEVVKSYLKQNYQLKHAADEIYYLTVLQLPKEWRYWSYKEEKSLFIYPDTNFKQHKEVSTLFCKRIYMKIENREPTQKEITEVLKNSVISNWQENLVVKLVVEKLNIIIQKTEIDLKQLNAECDKAAKDYDILYIEISKFMNEVLFEKLKQLIAQKDLVLTTILKTIRMGEKEFYSLIQFLYVWKNYFSKDVKGNELVKIIFELYKTVKEAKDYSLKWTNITLDFKNYMMWISGGAQIYHKLDKQLSNTADYIKRIIEKVSSLDYFVSEYLSIDSRIKQKFEDLETMVIEHPKIIFIKGMDMQLEIRVEKKMLESSILKQKKFNYEKWYSLI